MHYTSNQPVRQPSLNSKHEPYTLSTSSNHLDYRHHSQKNISKRDLSQYATTTQNIEEPFYFKLSNSSKNRLERRVEPKPELINIQNMKKMLSHNYSEEIAAKYQQQRVLQRKKIMQEKDFLSHLEKHNDFEQRQLNRLKSEYNKNLNEELNRKKMVMEINKMKQRQVDLSYKPRQNSLVHKAEAWRNFYQQAYSFRNSVAKEYEEYMKEEKKYEQKRNKSQLLNLHSDQKDYGPHKQFERHMKQYQTESLKSILEKQIHQRIDQKLNGHNSLSCKSLVYNPIMNPIDYKMDLNNKYILKQLSPKRFFQ